MVMFHCKRFVPRSLSLHNNNFGPERVQKWYCIRLFGSLMKYSLTKQTNCYEFMQYFVKKKKMFRLMTVFQYLWKLLEISSFHRKPVKFHIFFYVLLFTSLISQHMMHKGSDYVKFEILIFLVYKI